MLKKKITAITAIGIAAGMALVGCSAPGDNTGTTPPEGESKGSINLAVFNGWDEGIAVSELWKAILSEKGYEVELQPADPGAVFVGLQSGDYDFTMDVWLPGTHADYLKTFGDDIVELGAWNTESKLTIAVNEDSPITSLAELAANADAFNNRLIGIES
ncbi:MAG: glycine betaine ABC transporter substrate-binding protein, partial [Microbacteriaceae bacterium]